MPAEFRPLNIKLGYALLMIVLPSSSNCTKPFVSGCYRLVIVRTTYHVTMKGAETG